MSAQVHRLPPRASSPAEIADFRKSQEQATRNLIRQAVRSHRGFTKSERDVTLALINVWFHHKDGAEGYIHPGRRLLASRARVSQRTVTSLLARLRDAGVLVVLGHLNGGPHMATQYAVNEMALLDLCAGDWVKRFLRLRRPENRP